MKRFLLYFIIGCLSFSMRGSILLINFGCPCVPLIKKKIEGLGEKTYIRPWNLSYKEFKKINPDGIVLSGGHGHIYQAYNPYIPPFMLEHNKPILGICYGMQALSEQLGGKTIATHKPEKGPTPLLFDTNSPLFAHIKQNSSFWMSREDKVIQLPAGYKTLAATAECPIAAFADESNHVYAVQFHPEMSDLQGTILFANFLAIVYKHALNSKEYREKIERIYLHILLLHLKKLKALSEI